MTLATTVVRSATRSMRVIALPLTPHCKVDGKPVEHLTYYHFVTPPGDKNTNSWLNWGVTKASDLWANFGKAPERNWKRRAFLYGERLVDRLDFEELALKSLDPSLGPRLSDIVPRGSKKSSPSHVIPLVYPPSVCESPVPHLHRLVGKRTPRHKKGFWFWLALSPLTAPLKLIPIIPNFPFFFCAWRSWSHYRAYKASQYLEGFLHQGAIVPEASAALDAIYAKYAPPPDAQPGKSSLEPASTASHPSNTDSSTSTSGARLLLTKDAVPELVTALGIPEESTFAADMHRALEQARIRLEGRKTAA